MRTAFVVFVSIALGATLGVGITWARFGTSTSAEALVAALPATATNITPPPSDPKQSGSPKVVVDHEEFDFGPVERDTSVSHSFRFANDGTAPLTLKQGGTTCQKCTIAEIKHDTVEPGASVEVTVNYNASVSGPKFRQSATILTNDPGRPRVELTVSGTVTAIFDIEPHELVFSKLSVHDTKTLDAKLLNHLTDSVNIKSFEFSDPSTAKFIDVQFKPLDAEVLKKSNAKSGQLISVTIKPGLPLGQLRQTLTLVTDLPGDRPVIMQIMATIASDISLVGGGWDEDGGYVNIGPVKASEGAKRTMLVLIRGPERNNVQLSAGEIVPSFLKIAVGQKSPINDGAVVQVPVTIEIPPGSPEANHLGSKVGKLARVTLETTHPEAKQVKILVRFAIEN